MKITLRYFNWESEKEFYNWDVEVPDGTDASALCRQLDTEYIAEFELDDDKPIQNHAWFNTGQLEDRRIYSVLGPDVRDKRQVQAWIRKFQKFEFRSGD